MGKTSDLISRTSTLASGLARTVMAVLVVGALCTACARNDDAEQVRKRIAEGASLAEAHAIGDLLQLTTEEVRAMPMNLDRRGLRGVLWQAFRRYGAFALLYPRPTVEVSEDARETSTEFPFLIVKKEMTIPGLEELRDDPLAWAAAVGDAADLYRLRLRWIKQDGGWRVDQAFLERFDGAGFE